DPHRDDAARRPRPSGPCPQDGGETAGDGLCGPALRARRRRPQLWPGQPRARRLHRARLRLLAPRHRLGAGTGGLDMIGELRLVLVVLTALGCGLVAGVFFAFSSFVMPALSRLPPAQGVAAMQAINVAAVTPLFMTALFGTAFACAVLAVAALAGWREPEAPWLLVGAVLYLVGVVGVTMGCTVRRTNALAALPPEGAEAAALWPRYLAGWTAWNHVRTATGLAAAAAFTLALW